MVKACLEEVFKIFYSKKVEKIIYSKLILKSKIG